MHKYSIFIENALLNVFSQILLVSLISIAVIILIFLVKTLFKNKLSVKYHYYIWFILMVRLIVPFTPNISQDNIPIFSEKYESITIHENKYEENSQDLTKQESNTIESNTSYINSSISEETTLENVFSHSERNEDLAHINSLDNNIEFKSNNSNTALVRGIFEICSKIWVLGILLLIIYIMVINIILKSKINKTRVLKKDTELQVILDECKKLLNINRKIPVIIQGHIKTPAIYGVFAPKLLIHFDAVKILSTDEMRHVILHELCHYKGRDVLMSMFQLILNIVHWFNPFIWYAFKKINEDREPVCDQMVLSYLKSKERKSYAKTLLKILRYFSENYWVYNTTNMSMGRLSSMEWRLKLINTMKKGSFKTGNFVLILVILLGVASGIVINRNLDFHIIRANTSNLTNASQLERGAILDRNGYVLAIDVEAYKIALNPMEIEESNQNLTEISKNLSNILNISQDYIMTQVKKLSRYVVIKREVDLKIGDEIKEWIKDENIKGVMVEEANHRFYPNDNLAAHVIGFAGHGHQGLEGVELVFDKYLSEVSDYTVDKENNTNLENKFNVLLTIDSHIQHIASRFLDKAIKDSRALNGTAAIIMDPKNGEILAMASKPDFDLNDPWACPPGKDPLTWNGYTMEDVCDLYETVWRNKCTADYFIPGSTFSAITTAGALEEGILTPKTAITNQSIIVQDYKIECSKSDFHKVESFHEAFNNSCNPAFAKIALELGIDSFYEYVRAFGFYDKTGIDLLEEASVLIHHEPSQFDLARASFGQGFAIRPIQLINAYSAIANDGKMMRPQIVKK
ncbi:M56 family metallopeptidase [Herbivorax sp. ANBcel31]|uniref:M56 family metallopeptidase n=1 Tax=Herbivorax sp. ANBcel31 TaxID=3069754 RepID=UPI0027B4F3FD|nr:M56 family metallopeptidase [Herbivorax sp. ANBcel31]MDQ2085823.1 M56 family metallopeptidase [Herbivorax sp. ANBcel31]